MMEKQIYTKKFSEKNQKVVYEVARKFGGQTTVSDIYANSNLSIDEIENVLASLNAKNYVESSLDEETSVIKYTFPDIKKHFTPTNFVSKIGLDKLILRVKYNNSSEKPTHDLEKAIMQTAQEFQGNLTMSKIVEYTGLNVNEAEDILSLLSAKGICKREFNSDFHNPQFYFPEIIESAKIEEDNSQYKNPANLLGLVQNLSNSIVGKFKKNTDRMLIKGKVSRYKRKYKKNMFLDTVLPGTGHLSSKQWTGSDYIIMAFIPFILSAGMSAIITPAFLRYQTLRYYSLSERDFKNKVGKVNFVSLMYATITSLAYADVVGIEGIKIYYHFLFSLIGL